MIPERSSGAQRVETIRPIKTIFLSTEVQDFCRDGNNFLLLEQSGARIRAYDSEFTVAETIPVSILSPKGIYADRFYIYLYNEQTIYRLSKDSRLIQPLVNNVRVSGLIQYAPGELLISDKERKQVWLKTLFGESRVFLDRSDVKNPGALTLFSDGSYGLIANGERLLRINRAGIITGDWRIPQSVDLLTSDFKDRALLMRRGKSMLLVLSGSLVEYSLHDVSNPVQIQCLGNWIFVLDNYRQIVVYPLPD
ncbi:MAG: hypothetical protein ABIK54_05695 [candidate division WOR-3 bacterium]